MDECKCYWTRLVNLCKIALALRWHFGFLLSFSEQALLRVEFSWTLLGLLRSLPRILIPILAGFLLYYLIF